MYKVNVYFDLDGVIVPRYSMAQDEVKAKTEKDFIWNRYYIEDMDCDESIKEILRKCLANKDHACPTGDLDDVTKAAILTVSKISELKMCRVAFATSREKFLVGLETEYWLRDKFPEICKLGAPILWCTDKNKAVKLSRCRCDILVEDNLSVANSAACQGIGVYLVNAPYNKGPIVNSVRRIDRCDLWDIYEELSVVSKIREVAYYGEKGNE